MNTEPRTTTPGTATLLEQAGAVLDENWRGGYTVPSARLYPFQWSWDSGFIALGHACHRPERAMVEIQSMFKGQWRNGMLPHMNFHRVDPAYFPGPEMWGTQDIPERPPELPTSGITQPPVFAFVVERIARFAGAQLPGWAAFEREMYPRILAVHRYLYTQRDPQGEGLVYIQHNWESADNSPAWDDILDSITVPDGRDLSLLRRDLQGAEAAQRPTNANYQRYLWLVDFFIQRRYRDDAIAAECPFLVQDVLFNSVLVKSNAALLAIARRLGEPTSEIEGWQAKAIAAVNRKLWDPETRFYYSYDMRAERQIRIKTALGLMPLFAGACDDERARHLADHIRQSFTGGAGWRLCPTTAVLEPAFDPVKYWRGPVWVNMNWMLYHGLLRYGFTELAARVRQDTFDLLEAHGLYEYFDPRPAAAAGENRGLGASRFSWSAALALDFVRNPTPV